ncbi:MAG TPA: hypothetical protein PKA28_17415 [Methylomusa anaerophila]|uniref:Uncharacterized protein n=1 Tax=Methylomusa anaerophila TaxID=1930071 RepID=A0A348AML9_9FIRM|nr:hypothetical protein [Methylomusa anaerophila]BBB92317.1 hypothetical protein MAMMFC1_03002 [Methylomusa anaerophila]HML90222.1 hypothetical protein [Methylomusa anaerophila]
MHGFTNNNFEKLVANYQLTRVIFAVRTLQLLERINEEEANKAEPDATIIASVAQAIAAILNATSGD